MLALSLNVLSLPTPEAPGVRVEVVASVEEGRVVLHDLAVDGGELDHVDRVVLDPRGELEIELAGDVGWSFSGGEVERSWELVVHGLPVQEPRIEELERVELPLVVTAPWPTRPWWPLPVVLVVAVVGGVVVRRRGVSETGSDR